MEQVHNVIEKLVRKYKLPVRWSEVTSQSLLNEELGLDSLLIVQLAIEISDSFQISLDECQIEDWLRVEDIERNLIDLKVIGEK
ncbi:MAG: acyl carrier protein [Bdellovibrionales bacterium]|nr:acyl carrier protein [Bdellovibrionales bacterium]